jgi:hypothetical protein
MLPPVDTPISVPVIIPNYNARPALAQCLQSLEQFGGVEPGYRLRAAETALNLPFFVFLPYGRAGRL